jgi:hypothetical protein
VALLEKRRYLNNRSGDFPQVILIVPSHVPNNVPSCECYIGVTTVERPDPKDLSTFSQCTELPLHRGFKLTSSRSGVRRFN